MKWRLILKSLKNKEMQKKVFAVIAMIIIFRALAHIPIPFAEPAQLKQVLDNLFKTQETPQLLSFINVLSGNALQNFSIMLVGLGPYITASIIMQLLTKAFPRLETLQKDEGEYGRKKINQYTRIVTLPLAIVQAIGTIFIVRQSATQFGGLGDVLANASIDRWVLMVAALVGGSMILMWLGELLTEQGLGNGTSLLITVGVVSSLPGIAGSLISATVNKDAKLTLLGKTLPIDARGLQVTLVVLVLSLILTLLVVYLNEAQRRITISYAKRIQGSRSYGGVSSMLPVKLIIAGVVPIIFALSFLSIPSFVGQLIRNSSSQFWSKLGADMVSLFQTPQAATFATGTGWKPYLYPVVYFVLVFAFTFFYTNVTFNSKEIAENLQKQGGFIADKRPGAETEKYLASTVSKLTLFGAIALGVLAVFPYILLILSAKFPSWPIPNQQIQIGGTSLLILVSVSLETLRQIESKALMLTYDDYSTIPDMDTEVPKKKKLSVKKLFTRVRKK